MEDDFVTVARVGDIPPGEGAAFPVGERLIAVFNDDGRYCAIDDLCPHQGASLSLGDLEDGIVACPLHGWRFRVCDGTWADNPRIRYDSFEVRVQGDEIQVCPTPRPPESD